MWEAGMATRRLWFALWQYHRRLNKQALAQESTAAHLITLAGALHVAGKTEAATYLVRAALRFRVKALCCTAQANALN
jgi:Tfp pilus assembly protein PilW